MSSPIEMRRYLAIMDGREPVKSAKEPVEETKKDMSMRDMLGKMRNLKNKPSLNLNENTQQLNEFVDAPSMALDNNNIQSDNNTQSDNSDNLTTDIDREEAKDTMNKYFSEPNVTIIFKDFIVKGDGVLLSGTINNQLEFVLTATRDNATTDVDVNYLKGKPVIDKETGKEVINPETGEVEMEGGFDSQDPENSDIVKKLNDYQDIFYKYWREQLFN